MGVQVFRALVVELLVLCRYTMYMYVNIIARYIPEIVLVGSEYLVDCMKNSYWYPTWQLSAFRIG